MIRKYDLILVLGSISKSVIEEESIGECFPSSQIFHAIPSPNFSALWNSARSSVLASRLSSAIFRPLLLIIPCSNSPRVRLRRIPSKFGLERLNLPMSLNPFPNALFSLALCFYAITVLEILTLSFISLMEGRNSWYHRESDSERREINDRKKEIR